MSEAETEVCEQFEHAAEGGIDAFCPPLEIDTLVLLNASGVEGWTGDRLIKLTLAPFEPFKGLSIVRAIAYLPYSDGMDAGNTLRVQFAFWDADQARYFLWSVDYLKDTKCTFGHHMDPYPKSKEQLDQEWGVINNAIVASNEKVCDVTGMVNRPGLISRAWWHSKQRFAA